GIGILVKHIPNLGLDSVEVLLQDVLGRRLGRVDHLRHKASEKLQNAVLRSDAEVRALFDKTFASIADRLLYYINEAALHLGTELVDGILANALESLHV